MLLSSIQAKKETNASSIQSGEPVTQKNSTPLEPEDSVSLTGDNLQTKPPSRYFIADLERDGYMDLIKQESGHGVSAKEAADEEGFFLLKPETERCIYPAPLFNEEWELVGAGNFSLQRTTGLIFQHRKTGEVVMCPDAGDEKRRRNSLDTVFASEIKDREIVATCDLDKDKKSDILWQKPDGTIHAWLMDGSAIKKEVEFEKNPNDGPEWHVVGAGRFHGHGRNDMVMQKDDGTTKIAFYDGMKFLSEHELYSSGIVNFLPISEKPFPFTDKISCVGDVNEDGHTDILCADDGGSLWLSVMKGKKEKYCVGIE